MPNWAWMRSRIWETCRGGAGLLEYVEGHIHLRQTFAAARLGGWLRALAKAADGAELGLQGGFENSEDHILEVIVHGGLLSMGLRTRMPYLCRSVNTKVNRPTSL
jgi:hypothetical protein